MLWKIYSMHKVMSYFSINIDLRESTLTDDIGAYEVEKKLLSLLICQN